MSRHMRTTVRLQEGLMAQAKREAQRRGQTLTSMIEQGLRLMLAQTKHQRPRRRVRLPVCRAGGGTFPGVNLDDSASLVDIMEERS